jgi:tetratricopeptide (TPR) repeat protein
MSSPSQPEASSAVQPVSAATRRRLQQSFEHATRNANKGDHDYAHNMYTQCVVGDPGNLIYAQAFLANLHRKYNNNKKGGKLAALKGAGHKASIKKAVAKKDWIGAIKSGCDMLALNPWDIPSLVAMSKACEALGHDECQLYYLRSALDVNPKELEVNRLAGLALERMGQFDQAIACWHRVEQIKPGDEEAQRMISNLTINKTIQQGRYEEKATGEDSSEKASAKLKTAAGEKDESRTRTREDQLRDSIVRSPADIPAYLELADLYAREDRLDDAEQILGKALDASGGGDHVVRERLEELQIERARQRVELADARAVREKTEESIHLARQVRSDANRLELEIYAARCERNPANPALHFELGLRLKRAGRMNEAIQNLQTAKGDARRKGAVLLELGECFHHIKQYKLALTHYDHAVEVSGEREPETKKLALYRAGKLAMGLKDLDAAEKYLTQLAEVDFGYKDVAGCLDKLNQMRHNDGTS